MTDDTNITVQEVNAEPVEYVEIWIPIYRYAGSNNWYVLSACSSREDAVQSLNQVTYADVKILHHTEKRVTQ